MFGPHRRLFALLIALVLVLTACNVAVRVDIEVAEDGSGTVVVDVELDEGAQARIPDLDEQLRVDDLIAAGWTVTGPDLPDGSGVVRVRAEKPFGAPDQLDDVLDELTGPDGAFQDFEMERIRSFGKTEFQLRGTIDFTAGLDLFTDAELVESLDGELFGRDLEDLATEIGPLADAVDVQVRTVLPGGDGGGSESIFQPRLDDAEPITVDLSVSDEDLVVKLLRWVAIAAFILFLASVVLNLLGWLIERIQRRGEPSVRTPAPVSTRVPGGDAPVPTRPPVPATQSRAATGRSKRLALVVLDTPGVVYGLDDDATAVLGSFLSERGASPGLEILDDAYRQVTLGRISTAELWDQLGLTEDPAELDAAFVEHVPMARGARDFVREMQRRKLRVASLGNSALDWTRLLRARDELEGIDPWVVSGEVGVRKPDPGIFEALRRSSGVPYEDCLMIDSRLTNLDAARTLGMNTVWFTTRRPRGAAPADHPIVTSFAEFFRRRS